MAFAASGTTAGGRLGATAVASVLDNGLEGVESLVVAAREAASGGHDARSPYVERYWLPILGPSTTWLVRLLAHALEVDGDGVELPLVEVARSLGLSQRPGRRAPLARALGRAADFNLVTLGAPDPRLEVSLVRAVPSLSGRLLERLPPGLLAEHRRAYPDVRPSAGALRHADQLAATLVALGEDDDAVVAQLVAWRIAPGVARVSARRARAASEERRS